MAKQKKKLIYVDVPRGAFDLARERTSLLIGQLGFFFNRSRYVEPGDALGDALACAYLQGVNDTYFVVEKNKSK